MPRVCQVRVKNKRLIDEGGAIIELPTTNASRVSGETERASIVLAEFNRPSSQPSGFGNVLLCGPTLPFAPAVTKRCHGVGQSKFGVELDRLPPQCQRLVVGLTASIANSGKPAQISVVGVEARRRLAHCTLDLCLM
jgi:hypothetical protein